jgi:MFS family permease
MLDLDPLRRFPQFRRLWIGYAIRQMGAQLTTVAVLYQVYALTHSSFDVGLLSLIQVLPGLMGSVFGGAIADAVDRKALLIGTALLIAATSIGLAVNGTQRHPSLDLLFLFSALNWGLAAVDAPTRTAVQFALVDREAYVAANVLRLLLQQTSVVVGPALAGLVLGLTHSNFGVVYWLDVATAAAALQALFRLPRLPPQDGGRDFSLGSIAEGLRFVKGHVTIRACFLIDLNATVLGLPTTLYPYMALEHFHGGSITYGLLSAAPGVGAVGGSVLSGWMQTVTYPGRAVLYCVGVWGIALSVFGIAPWLILGVGCLVVAGWANSVSATLRNAIMQIEAPDRLRGRLSALAQANGISGPRLGNAESGLVAAVTNPQFSIVSGGIGCLVGTAIIARALPALARYSPRRSASPVPVQDA